MAVDSRYLARESFLKLEIDIDADDSDYLPTISGPIIAICVLTKSGGGGPRGHTHSFPSEYVPWGCDSVGTKPNQSTTSYKSDFILSLCALIIGLFAFLCVRILYDVCVLVLANHIHLHFASVSMPISNSIR